MVVLKPFRGWRYDLDVVGDPASVLSPPYDLITPEMQESLRRLNRYNVVHLEAGESLEWSSEEQSQYSGTASLFADWTAKGVLKRDADPSFYLLMQEFEHQGNKLSRLGLTACVGVEDYETRQVLPHEYTEAGPVRDRVSLMEACGANISPIMSAYLDADGQLTPLFQQVMAGQPVLDTQDDSGYHTTLWRISGNEHLESLSEFFRDVPVFLADGHHRYEAALQYRKKKTDQGTELTGSGQAYDFMMMTLISFDDPGLLVLPYHRMLGGLHLSKLAKVQDRLYEIFDSRPLGSSSGYIGSAEALVEQVAIRGKDRHALGMVGLDSNEPQLLTLKTGLDSQKWGPLAISEAWILEEQVLKPVLGDATLEHLGYIHDHAEAVDLVVTGKQQAAFLLKPFPMTQFQEIVGEGQKLPRKSTFFYPKLPTGLVINQLDGTL